MATEKIERKIPGRGDELFRDVQQTLGPYVKKYSLSEQVDAERKHIRVKKTGLNGELQVEGDTVKCELEYSPLMPRPIRSQITKGVVSVLDQIGAKKSG